MKPVLGAFFGALCLPLLSGCPSRLPGPAECEHMAARLVNGGASRTDKPTQQQRRLAQIVTHGCLTTPFDFEAVSCVEETRRLQACTEQLGARAPERKKAIQDFLARARRRP